LYNVASSRGYTLGHNQLLLMAFPLAPPQALLLPAAAAGASASRRSAAGAQPPLAAPDARLAFAPRLARPRGRRGASVAASAAPAKDRGEWTRFLEVSGDSVRAATVDCKLLPGARAAEVTVVAPDRPGLLSDIAAAIASIGLTVNKARGEPELPRAITAAGLACSGAARARGCARRPRRGPGVRSRRARAPRLRFRRPRRGRRLHFLHVLTGAPFCRRG
jgi:hypothetical protein